MLDGDGIEEGHGGAEGFPDDLDGMLGFLFAVGVELLAAGGLVFEEGLGELTVLDFGEDGLHGLAALIVDDAGTADIVAPLGRIRNAVPHVGEAAAIDEVDDELELVEDFEVSALGLVAGFDQGFKAALNEGAHAAAEDGLLAEEIGLGLFFEGGFENSGAGAADALEVAEIESVGVAGGILMNGDEAGDASAFGEDLTDAMAGSLGRGEAYVDVLGGDNGLEMDVEAVSEEEQCARLQVGGDFVGLEFGLGLVGGEDHYHVGPLGCLGGGGDFKAGLLGFGAGLGGGR